MEAHYRAFQGRLVIKIEGEDITDLFEKIGPVAEALDGDNACGKCASPQIFPRARKAQEFTYYELVCSDCGAKLSFGQHKKGGTIWPKRTDEHGNLLDHRGWRIYQALPAPPEEPAQPPPRRTAPPAQAPNDPRLAAYLEQAKDYPNGANDVVVDICEKIAALSDDNYLNKVWTHATDAHGVPAERKASVGPVITSLYNALTTLERKAK